MQKCIAEFLADRAAEKKAQEHRETIEAWSIQVGRDAARLWVLALAARDTARLSNA